MVPVETTITIGKELRNDDITEISPSDTNRLEWLSQDGKPSPQLCDPEFDPDCPEQHKGARGRWLDGVRYPLRTETHSMMTTNDYLYVFGEFLFLCVTRLNIMAAHIVLR